MSTVKHAYPAFTFPICRQPLMMMHLPSSSQGLVDPQEHKKRGGRRGRGSALGDDEGSDGEVRCMVAVLLAECLHIWRGQRGRGAMQEGNGGCASRTCLAKMVVRLAEWQGRAGHDIGAVFASCVRWEGSGQLAPLCSLFFFLFLICPGGAALPSGRLNPPQRPMVSPATLRPALPAQLPISTLPLVQGQLGFASYRRKQLFAEEDVSFVYGRFFQEGPLLCDMPGSGGNLRHPEALNHLLSPWRRWWHCAPNLSGATATRTAWPA